jgi:PIN domain nuclease of toxin-antitoxin system
MSQIILLDTHIWFWLMTQEHQRFPAHWLGVFDNAEQVAISAVSCFEMALAHQRGKLELPCDPRTWMHEALTPAGVDLLPLTPSIAARAVTLSPIHKDPFDRIIIATALEHQAQLASIDALFVQYPELNGCLLK